MQWKKLVFSIACLLAAVIAGVVFADDHERRHHDDDHEEHGSERLAPVSNETYARECGACHFAYQPGLLPAGSWEKILGQLPSHFGEDAALDEESLKTVGRYLGENAAEGSSSKRSRKILRSLKGQAPARITDVPYIREKHHELDSRVFERPSVGSFSNCIACHATADRGDYDDDSARIPR